MAAIIKPTGLNTITSFIGQEFAFSRAESVGGHLEPISHSHGKGNQVRVCMVPIGFRAITAYLCWNMAKLTSRSGPSVEGKASITIRRKYNLSTIA